MIQMSGFKHSSPERGHLYFPPPLWGRGQERTFWFSREIALVVLGALVTSYFAVAADSPRDIRTANTALGRGMNLGNALDAPNEGAWGVRLKAEYFVAIKDAGFQTVRL